MSEQASEEVREQVLARAEAMCECTMSACKQHGERCTQSLRGRDWFVHRVRADLPFTAENALAVSARCRPNNRTLRG